MATLEIIAPRQFSHVGDLRRYQVPNNDPRSADFNWESVRIDLSRCEFVRPAAALWCVVYPLLTVSKSINCEMLTPLNVGVAAYLKGLGLFEILKSAGVDLYDGDVPAAYQGQPILPLTQLRSVSEVEDLEDSILENLERGGLSSANLYADVSVVFAELANNAVEHAESAIYSYGMVHLYEIDERPLIVCGVADGGIGIRASLVKNPSNERNALNDWTAIEYATQEFVSGTQDTQRGIGLYEIANGLLQPNRELFIHSGNGFCRKKGNTWAPSHSINGFPGTSTVVCIPS